MKNVIYRRKTCRACNSNDLELYFQLKPTPIGDAYITYDQINIIQDLYPIDLFMCKTCGLAQLLDVIDPDILYGTYIYNTVHSVGLNKHFESYSKEVANFCNLPLNSLVIDLGSNDGTLLSFFKNNGYKVLGVEPAKHIAEEANKKGVDTFNSFFNKSISEEILKKYGKAKLITANNVFANIDEINDWVQGIANLLDDDGVFVFESYYLLDVINNKVFDFIYHEHLTTFSIKPVVKLFSKYGLNLVAVQHVNTKGGSLRYFVQKNNGPIKDDKTVQIGLKEEEDFGLYEIETYQKFNKDIDVLKKQTLDYLTTAKQKGLKIAAFGASITGTTLTYHYELCKLLDYFVDDNTAKQGLFSPGIHLPVYPTSKIYEDKPDIVVLLAWRFADIFIENNKKYLEDGGIFILPVPNFKIINL